MADDLPIAMGIPDVHPPRRTSPPKRNMHSRTVSRSSSRQHGHARDFDPILRNLSPTTTLRAFSDHDALSPGDVLHTSLQTTTSAQRSWGTKAARICLDVRSWARELAAWEWPGSFEVPDVASNKQRAGAMSLGSSLSQDPEQNTDTNETEYWGSLPAKTAQEYEQRADQITQQLDEIDVEELKEFVLSAHNEAGHGSASLNDSIGAIGAATDLRRLDDFTAIITATILQALPYLSHLNRLLDMWNVRLTILRQTPMFLKALAQARADLDQCWAAIAVASGGEESETAPHATFNRGRMIEMQSIVEQKVGSLGRKLDRFLDDLEGRSETVPESWIEDMEALEQQYAEWMVRAQRKILENELKKKNRMSRNASPAIAQRKADDQGKQVDPEQPVDDTGIIRFNDRNLPTAQPPLRLTPSEENTPADTPPVGMTPVESRSLTPALSFDPRSGSDLDLARDDSETLPSEQADPIASPTRSGAASRKSSRSARHVPIILPYDGGDGQAYPTEGITGDLISRSGTPASDTHSLPAPSSSEAPSISVAKRRALFSGDLERTQSLQKATLPTKSPVRPFEHASNAFARLFKSETSTPERSRSSSLRSEVGRNGSGSGTRKTDNGIIWGGRTPPNGPSPKQSLRRKTLDSSPQDAPKGQEQDSVGGQPVAADADAPPVPELPPKSPRRSMHSPRHSRPPVPAVSPLALEERQTEPFPGFNFGEHWPLSPERSTTELDNSSGTNVRRVQAQANTEGDGTGLSSPRKPLESDYFHSQFVDSFPGTPDDGSQSPMHEHAGLPEHHVEEPTPPSAQSPVRESGVPTVDPSMLGSSPHSVHRGQFVAGRAGSASMSPRTSRPNHIDLPPTAISLPVPLNSADGPLTPNSIASDTYSPEIQDASVSYFQMASPSLSRTNSVANISPNQVRPRSARTSSPLRFRQSTYGRADIEEDDDEEDATDALSTRRFSKMSIESQPRLEVKSIDLSSRRKSSSSAIDLEPQPNGDSPSSPVSRSMFPTPPTIHEERPRSPVSPLAQSPGGVLRHKTSNLSMVSDQCPTPEKPSLNTFMGKRRGLGIQSTDPPPTARLTPKPEHADSIDRHVSDLLDRLPIRFRTGATTPQPRTAEQPRTFSGPRPKTNPRAPSRTSLNPSGLTLAPADPSPSRRSAEPEVKLYHLTQAGREEPIKLFVRLVGEGERERVMVRVGGGWADLADYLRQYAEHHGSRTVSGEIDVKAFGSPPPGSSTISNTGSGSNSNIHPALRRRASGPMSAEVGRAKAASSVASASPPTPVHEASERAENENGDENVDPAAAYATPSRPPVPLRSGSRPSTADSLGVRPGSKHSWSEIGMAGPGSGKKNAGEKGEAGLDERKNRWVEGMVERVQRASGEKNKGDAGAKQFAEMGKVGGTRRVVFRKE